MGRAISAHLGRRARRDRDRGHPASTRRAAGGSVPAPMCAPGRVSVSVLVLVLVLCVSASDGILNGGGVGGGGAGGAGGGLHWGSAPSTLCDSPFCDCSHGSWGNVTCRCPTSPVQGEVVLRADGELRLPEHTTALRVEGCARVEVLPRAVHALRHLRSVELRGAQELRLHQYAFSRPGGSADGAEESSDPGAAAAALAAPASSDEAAGDQQGPAHEQGQGPRVLLEGTRLAGGVPSYAFRGRLAEVALRRCTVDGALAPFAFASLSGTRLLELTACRVAAVEGQALKRFAVERLVLSEVQVEAPLPSRALADLVVRAELLLQRVRAPRLRSAAVSVRGPRLFTLAGCELGHVEGEALRVHARGPLWLRDNAFGALEAGAFAGLGADAGARLPLRLAFANNSAVAFAAGALAFNATALDAQLSEVRVARPCDCAEAERWLSALAPAPPESIACQAPADKQGKSSAVRYQSLAAAGCSALGWRRGSGASLALLFGAVGAGVAALALSAGGAWAWHRWRRRRRRRRRRQAAGERSPGCRRWSPGAKDKRKDPAAKDKDKAQSVALVLPARTYHETELHVELERAEPLDK